MLPICYSKIKAFKGNSIDSLIDFSFNVCDGYIRPAKVKSEFKGLMNYLQNEDIRIMLEIGTARGGSLFLLSQILSDDSTIISIDLSRGSFRGGYPIWKIPFFKILKKKSQKLILIRKSSHEESTLQLVKRNIVDSKVDFLLIDGDHTYNGVKTDFELYRHLVRPGGLIAFHDIAHNIKTSSDSNCEVDVCWNEIKREYEHLSLLKIKIRIGRVLE